MTKRKVTFTPGVARSLLYVFQLLVYLLVGIGAGGIYWPLGPLCVGLMVWLDLRREAK